MRLWILGALMVVLGGASAMADIKTQTVEYKQGDTVMKGYLAYDDAVTGQRPGVLVMPEWWGLTDYAKHRAEQLARMGYVAFAADMYGDGVSVDTPDEAGKLAGKVKGDIALMRARANAALDVLKNDKNVDPAKIAVIGYCFGGTVGLEMARGGSDILGVVSFHGGLDTPNPATSIKARILVCTGGEDAFVPPKQVEAFEDEMRKAGADWQVIVYSGAHHAFTNPDADRHGIPNIAYNAAADARSWQAMKDFFAELFGPTNK